MMRDN
jgi:hypothetical protein